MWLSSAISCAAALPWVECICPFLNKWDFRETQQKETNLTQKRFASKRLFSASNACASASNDSAPL